MTGKSKTLLNIFIFIRFTTNVEVSKTFNHAYIFVVQCAFLFLKEFVIPYMIVINYQNTS
jgi:hypothetical protein